MFTICNINFLSSSWFTPSCSSNIINLWFLCNLHSVTVKESAKIGTDLLAVFLVSDEDAAVKGNPFEWFLFSSLFNLSIVDLHLYYITSSLSDVLSLQISSHHGLLMRHLLISFSLFFSFHCLKTLWPFFSLSFTAVKKTGSYLAYSFVHQICIQRHWLDSCQFDTDLSMRHWMFLELTST